MQRISASEFGRWVEEAIASLPEEFAAALENVAIVVEEEPSDDDLEAIEDDEHDDGDDELLGIFRGVPLTEQHHDDIAPLPPVIAIFRRPILRIAASRADAIAEIQDTVIHEIGHLFGLEDDTMPY